MDETKANVVGLVQEYDSALSQYDVNNYYAGPRLYTRDVTLSEEYNADYFEGKVDEFIARMQAVLKDYPESKESVESLKAAMQLANSVLSFSSVIDSNLNMIQGCIREMDNSVMFAGLSFRKALETANNQITHTKSVLKNLNDRANKEIDK